MAGEPTGERWVACPHCGWHIRYTDQQIANYRHKGAGAGMNGPHVQCPNPDCGEWVAVPRTEEHQ